MKTAMLLYRREMIVLLRDARKQVTVPRRGVLQHPCHCDPGRQQHSMPNPINTNLTSTLTSTSTSTLTSALTSTPTFTPTSTPKTYPKPKPYQPLKWWLVISCLFAIFIRCLFR